MIGMLVVTLRLYSSRPAVINPSGHPPPTSRSVPNFGLQSRSRPPSRKITERRQNPRGLLAFSAHIHPSHDVPPSRGRFRGLTSRGVRRLVMSASIVRP